MITIPKGTRVLTCSHPSPMGVHWYTIERQRVKRSDGKTFFVKWVCVCESCYQEIRADRASLLSCITSDFVTDQDTIPAGAVT